MRSYYTLNTHTTNTETGILYLQESESEEGTGPGLSLRREGGYVAISVQYGPLEIALRPRFQELARVFERLRPVPGLQTTRQVGTGQAYLALGLRDDGSLMMRPTIVADATGHFCFNLVIDSVTREALYAWLNVTSNAE